MSTPTGHRQYRFRRPPGACEILFVRHGESAESVPGVPFPKVDGQNDPPLHEAGQEQARLVGRRLVEAGDDFGAVYVSTLQRTRQTAQPLLDHLGTDPVVEPRLREVHLGDFEDDFRARAAAGDPTLVRAWTEDRWDVIPNAEPTETFAERVRGAVTDIATRHADQTVVVFTHGGVIGKVMHLATGARLMTVSRADNASITHVAVVGDHWVVRSFNDTGHLESRFTADPLVLG